MGLTPQAKERIDAMSYEQLLSGWRFAPSGSSDFQGESGIYWGKRMAEMRDAPGGQASHVHASKSIGWEKEEV